MKTAAGFTLIESLLAGLILFGAIAVTAAAFRTDFTALARARENIRVAGELPFLCDRIALEMGTGLREGEGEYEGLRYQWQAQPLASRAALGKFDPDTMTFSSSSIIIHRMQVELELGVGRGAGRHFQYQETIWSAPP